RRRQRQMCIKRQTQDELAVAVNHQIANWQTKVSNGDIIAFIPPVAGG
ncbi:hypothetical protein D6D71_04005, partial [Moraxella catarrhalis]